MQSQLRSIKNYSDTCLIIWSIMLFTQYSIEYMSNYLANHCFTPWSNKKPFRRNILFPFLTTLYYTLPSKMSLRTLLKKDPTHFLVKYTIDKKTQIRTRGLLKTEDDLCLFYCIYISIQGSTLTVARLPGASEMRFRAS